MTAPPRRLSTRALRLPILLVVVFVPLWFTVLSPHPKPAPPPPSPSRTPAGAASYTLRGRIEQLPDPAVKGSTLQIHHEKVPTFTDQDGKVIGMNEMVMPFPPAAGLSLDGFAVGDNVEFTFEVRWDRIPFQQATRIAKLPVDAMPEISDAQK